MTSRAAEPRGAGRPVVAATALCSLAILLSGCGAPGGVDEWSYSDAFSTGKAECDSYLHSPFVESPPDVGSVGTLMYTMQSEGNRSLGFYSGSWVNDLEATLQYEFPIGLSGTSTTHGELGFDIGTLDGTMGVMRVTVSYDGAPGGFSVLISRCGRYEYALAPEREADAVRVDFTGAGVTLDDLRVSLEIVREPLIPGVSSRLIVR